MEKLSKDALFSIAIELNMPELLQFCATNSRINNLICKRNDIWNYKLKNEFLNYDESLKQFTSRETYVLLYKLIVLKEKLKILHSIKNLYNTTVLNFDKQIFLTIKKGINRIIFENTISSGELKITYRNEKVTV